MDGPCGWVEHTDGPKPLRAQDWFIALYVLGIPLLMAASGFWLLIRRGKVARRAPAAKRVAPNRADDVAAVDPADDWRDRTERTRAASDIANPS